MSPKWHLLSDKIPASKEEVLKILCKNRNLNTKNQIDEFISPAHPDKLTGADIGLDTKAIDKARYLIQNHIKLGHQIAIYGDYDVDGICSTAILWETIYSKYKKVFPHIPHREKEGYGLTEAGIDLCIEQDAKLIIAVDNGIVAHKQVEYCKSHGLDILIIDHHEESKTYPDATSILHSKKTSAAALSWYFAKYLNPDLSDSLLELAAISVISDMVPLIDINRSFAKYGLEKLRHTSRPGLLALFQQAAVDHSRIGTYEVGYILGPRLNASGRLEHALDSLRLLCTKNQNQAHLLALALTETNRSRQDLTLTSVSHAISMVESKYGTSLPKLLLVHDPSYHQGIIGLIAAKLVDKYHRPAIALSVGEAITKASARSVSGFDITEHIRSSSSLVTAVGGHAMAAGFSLETVNLEPLLHDLSSSAEAKITDTLLDRVIKIDCEILPNIVTSDFLSMLKQFEPFGLANPEPSFLFKRLNVVDARIVGKEGKHLKLQLTHDSPPINLNAIAFGQASIYPQLNPDTQIDIIFNLIEDNYNGKPSLQLKIKDIRIHSDSGK